MLDDPPEGTTCSNVEEGAEPTELKMLKMHSTIQMVPLSIVLFTGHNAHTHLNPVIMLLRGNRRTHANHTHNLSSGMNYF